MSVNNEQNTTTISYDAVEKYFLEEAISLLPDALIKETLQVEKLRFENAAILGISPQKLVGNNTARHCKDLLRKNQPLSFLYTFLCFLSEVSVLMLLFGLVRSIGNVIFSEGGFLSSFTYLYALILFSGIVAGNTTLRKHLNKILAFPFSCAKPADSEIHERKKQLKRKQIFSGILIFVITAGVASAVAYGHLQSKYTINITICFFAYIICMLLFGIHNVIYNSHMIPFLAIGSLRLLRKSKEVIHTACKAYLDTSYLQILSQANKTQKDCDNNPALLSKLQNAVYTRTVTTRIYCALALFLLIILDIMCILQLQGILTLAFIVFFAVSLVLTILFLTAVLSANYILKQTKDI